MNRGNRHMRYRRSVYRRRRIRVALIVSGIALSVLLLLFLFLGNFFFDKLRSEPVPKDDDSPSTEAQASYPFESVRHVNAPLLSTGGPTSEVFDRLRALADDGHTAVSIPLTDENGRLLYRSEQAASGNYAILGSSSLSLAELAEAAHAEGMYLCGTYVLSAAKEENALTRSVLLAESAAVLAEAFLDGLDDVVVLVPDLPVAQEDELIRFAEGIRTFAPNATVGLSLPESELVSPDAARIDALAHGFDFLALDLSRFGEEDPITFAEDRMASMLYYLLRYEMRVLIPALSDQESSNALLDAIQNESIDNRMTVAY